jgi:hypothetical protein
MKMKTICQNLWDTTKAVLTGNFTAVSEYNTWTERSQGNQPNGASQTPRKTRTN